MGYNSETTEKDIEEFQEAKHFSKQKQIFVGLTTSSKPHSYLQIGYWLHTTGPDQKSGTFTYVEDIQHLKSLRKGEPITFTYKDNVLWSISSDEIGEVYRAE